MKYFKVFNTENEYLEYIHSEECITPYVITLRDSSNTWISAEVHDYSKDYFTIESLEDNNEIKFTSYRGGGQCNQFDIDCSTDGGETWQTILLPAYVSGDDQTPIETTLATINNGDKLLIKKSQNNTNDSINCDTRTYRTISASGNFNACGNIMSLVRRKDTQDDFSTVVSYQFYELFNNCDKIISAENLILPATTLANSCYRIMFTNCTSLTTAPELPAATLANYCYCYMFKGCTSLIETPDLPATTLAASAYTFMFTGCISLTEAPELPATTLASNCYQNMFTNCTSLTAAPELPATTLVDRCYNRMFLNCRNLNYIKMLSDDIGSSVTEPMLQWVSGVTNTNGLFVKSSLNTEITEGPSGIPVGWTVHNDTYVEVTGVTISASAATVNKGSTYTLTANVLPSNAYDQVVSWSTSDSSVATVSNGVVTGVGCGDATITVTTHEKGYTATCNISVENHVTSIELNTYMAYFGSGGTYQLVETVSPSDACDKSVLWSSSDSSIVSVDSTGLVSGVTTGSARVTVTTVDGGYSKGCDFTVNPPAHATGVTLSDAAITVNKDDTYTLTATVMPNDAVDKSVRWSSSDVTIATVDSNGVVSGVASGDATITVTTVDGGHTAQCSVSVTDSPYTELEYIESTSDGGQYIDLDIKLYETLNNWYDIAIKYNVSGNGKDNQQPTLFGCQTQSSPWPGTFIRMNQAGATNTIGRYIGGTGKDNNLGNNNTDIELQVKTAPDRNVTNLNNSNQTHSWSTSLFCAFSDASGTPFRFIAAKLYYFKLFSKTSGTSQGTLVRDMMPCKRKSDNKVGLLDKVNNVFYVSPNGAEFVGGPEVSV